MDGIVRDLTTPALVQAIEGNLHAFWAYLWRGLRAESHLGPDLQWGICDPPYALFNRVVSARLEPEEADGAIEALLERARAAKVPLVWVTGPGTRPSDLPRRLLAHGFVPRGHSTGMAVDLRALNEGLPRPPDLSIDEVQDLQMLALWCHTLAAARGFPDVVERPLLDGYAVAGLDPDLPLRHFLARRGGNAVATSSLFLGAGVAGIHNLATVPEARRQGIGAAVTLRPLQLATAMGYRAGTVQSSEMGEGMYRRVGFEPYCTIGQYVWKQSSG